MKEKRITLWISVWGCIILSTAFEDIFAKSVILGMTFISLMVYFFHNK